MTLPDENRRKIFEEAHKNDRTWRCITHGQGIYNNGLAWNKIIHDPFELPKRALNVKGLISRPIYAYLPGNHPTVHFVAF